MWEDMFITIIITNNQKSTIGFPLAFYKTKGPIIRLIDSHTRNETDVPNSLGNCDLLENFTMIEPGKSLAMEWVIGRNALKQFGGPYVDVSAEITMMDTIVVDGKHIDFEGSDTIRIVSKDNP
jgi:hypothetical protein